MRDDTELFKQFMDNAGFKRWMTDTVFSLAYERAGSRAASGRVMAAEFPNPGCTLVLW